MPSSSDEAIRQAQAFLGQTSDQEDLSQLSDEELLNLLPPEPQIGFAGRIPLSAYQRGERNIFGNIFERPAAVTRAARQAAPPLTLLGPYAGITALSGLAGERARTAAQQAALNPSLAPQPPNYSQRLAEAYYRLHPNDIAFGGVPGIAQATGALAPVLAGYGADIAESLITSPPEALASILPFLRPVRQATQAVGQTRPVQAVGRFLTKERHLFRQPLTTETLVGKTPGEVAKLPASIRDIYLREKRHQLAQQIQQVRGETAQTAQAARASLKRLDEETLREFKTVSAQLEKQLEDEAFQVALRLKKTDIGPLLKQQKDRYADLAEGALARSSGVPPITPKQIIEEVNARFANNPRGLNLAYDRLRLDVLDEFGQLQGQLFSPRELLNELDRIGLTVPRSPTEAYTFADDVADELRDALLAIIERQGKSRGVDLGAIRQAKAEWAKWKPIQKRLLRGTRFFEQSETVTDAFVNRLMAYARTDRTKNAEQYFGEIQDYIGKDLAAPMRPIVEQMTALQRRQVALQIAKAAELERIGIQTSTTRARLMSQASAGRRTITDIEIQFAEKAERTKRVWQAIIGAGAITGTGGAVLYGVKKISEALSQ